MSRYISKWLVLGPIFDPAHQGEHRTEKKAPDAAAIVADIDGSALNPKLITSSISAAPDPDVSVTYSSALFSGWEGRWRQLEFSRINWDDINDIGDNIHQKLNPDFVHRHHALAFFLTFVNAPEETRRKLLVRSDDALRVWLNGQEVTSLAFLGDRDMAAAEAETEVGLKKGNNILLFAVAETHVEWAFSARFADDADLLVSPEKPVSATMTAGRIRQHLATMSDRYTVFEEDQVLTHTQLNGVGDWFEDQTRLGRTLLLGTGIVSGLRAATEGDGSAVSITAGFGLTTDGDLLHLPSPATFDRFRPYDDTRPAYQPFQPLKSGDGSFPLLELMRPGMPGYADSKSLRQLGEGIGAFVTLFFMENYVTDTDICSQTGCDNLGKECRSLPTFLLIRRDDVARLAGRVSPPGAALSSFPFIEIPRALLSSAVATKGQLIAAFRGAAMGSADTPRLHELVSSALSAVYSSCRDIFSDDPLPADRWPAWKSMLDAARGAFASTDFGIQYYYEFLKEVAETCNLLRTILAEDETWPLPPLSAFPKHLLLGNLDGLPGNRTFFRSSPLISRTVERLRHGRFLVERIDALISGFRFPPEKEQISITPSRSGGNSPEEGAIPFYYDPLVVYRTWNYRLSRLGMESRNRSCNASRYGGNANPLTTDDGYAPCYRIEGHLGKPVATAVAEIGRLIAEHNLPLAVRAVLVGNDWRKVLRPRRVTDLHRIHKILRADLAKQMEDVVGFTRTMTKEVKTAVETGIVRDDDGTDAIPLTTAAANRQRELEPAAKRIRVKMERSYEAAIADQSWKEDLKKTLETAGTYKHDFGHVIRTDFTTPFDSLIGSSHFNWLEWLEEMIRDRNRCHDNRLRLSEFISRHPGLEHKGEVPAGGTFIVVHNEAGTVVSDLSLPYIVPLDDDDDADEVVLPKPGLRPEFIRDRGVRVIPSLGNSMRRFNEEHVLPVMQGKLDRSENDLLLKQVEARIKDERLSDIAAVVEGRLEGQLGGKVGEIVDRHLDSVRGNIQSVTEKVGTMEKDYFAQLRSSLELMGNAVVTRRSAGTASSGALSEKIVRMRQQRAVLDFAEKAMSGEGSSPLLETEANREREILANSMVEGLESAAGADDAEAATLILAIATHAEKLGASAGVVREAISRFTERPEVSGTIKNLAADVAVRMG